MKKQSLKLIYLAALIGGVWFLGNAMYIPAKAVLAQHLLNESWKAVQAGEPDVKPWAWADTQAIARLHHHRLDEQQIILNGASSRVLAFAPGYVSGTAPLGHDGNSVISGHRDTHFAWLKEVELGDELGLDLPDGKHLRYAVYDLAVHDESETELLNPDSTTGLRLITCYPFDAVTPGGPLRYVVSAKPIQI